MATGEAPVLEALADINEVSLARTELDPVPLLLVRLAAPAAVIDHDFSRISGVRELPDGRLLGSDWIEETGSLVDGKPGGVRGSGRGGTGPAASRPAGALPPLVIIVFIYFGLPTVDLSPSGFVSTWRCSGHSRPTSTCAAM